MGGLGKTTLAQFIYNDGEVTTFFPLRIWVCVSEEFDLTRILKEIIFLINSDRWDGLTVNALQTRVRDLLMDSKFLLVLDDVWNEKLLKWIDLRNLLMTLENSSQNKILVTTRSLKVASIMSTSPAYELKGLPHKDSLALLAKWALGDKNGKQYPNLMRIGEQIVEKCKGVPLAVRTLGSLLFSKTDESEWISVRDNDIWRLAQGENDIMPVLRYSYHHLPSHLQRCLAYLSLYKKDSIFVSTDIIQFWMANRLLECPKQKDDQWEDVGAQYLKELWSRCLIQEVEDYGCYFTFRMHDLIHDLAFDVSLTECKTVHCLTEGIDGRLRHLSFSNDLPKSDAPKFLKKLERLRTIAGEGRFLDESFINFCISNFKYLRALDLSYSMLKVLPDSISNLKHLRYLNLHGCSHLSKLPTSFHKLQSLETLKMGGVKLMRLPDSMQNMVSLRYLEITFGLGAKDLGTVFQTVCWGSLRYLRLYRCYQECLLLEGIQYLTSLQTLYISECFLESLPRSLRFLKKLEQLQIEKCSAINLEMEGEDKDLHLNLKTFSVLQSQTVSKLPRLLLEGSASTLLSIRLEGCPSLYELPEWMQNLTSLQKLHIRNCPVLSFLPQGFHHLTALKQVKIENCWKLKKRYQRKWGRDWPKIAQIPQVDILKHCMSTQQFHDERTLSAETCWLQ